VNVATSLIGGTRNPPRLALNQRNLVSSYLVHDTGGVTIVDAGLPGHWAELGPKLAQMGRSPTFAASS
jgi:glyoxylase-like metal-dependent hydrolase (beta-lactamase superfamily II)